MLINQYAPHGDTSLSPAEPTRVLFELVSKPTASSTASESSETFDDSLEKPPFQRQRSATPPASEHVDRQKCLTKAITEWSEELQPSLSSSSSGTATVRNSRPHATGGQQLQNDHGTINHSIKRRARLNNLHQLESTSQLPTEYHPTVAEPKQATKKQKRSISANAILQKRIPFSSVDRHVPQRPPLTHNISFRTSKPPCILKGRELYTRARDHSQSPFRSVSASRSRETAERQATLGRPPVRPPQYTPSFVHGRDARPVHVDTNTSPSPPRQVSLNSFWTVGGRGGHTPGPLPGVAHSDGRVQASGTHAPLLTARFLDQPTNNDHILGHESRLALALEIDQANRILPARSASPPPSRGSGSNSLPIVWQNGRWQQDHNPQLTTGAKWTPDKKPEKAVPTVPFRVLDAPHLKDDYYCSVLAYCHSCRTLAVALAHKVYLWTEQYGVRYPPLPTTRASNFVTSLAFSSNDGDKNVLAVARHSGSVTLWSLLEQKPRFEIPHPAPASCVAFRPVQSRRKSVSSGEEVPCEDLTVGDDCGIVYLYSIEWPSFAPGSATLLFRIKAHSQNICGLAWSPDGARIVTGGNDNCALLFEMEDLVKRQETEQMFLQERMESYRALAGSPYENTNGLHTSRLPITPPQSPQRHYVSDSRGFSNASNAPVQPTRDPQLLTPAVSPERTDEVRGRSLLRGSPSRIAQPTAFSNLSSQLPTEGRVLPLQDLRPLTHVHRHVFVHSAAVKALAFAPWQPTLFATRGGSNDRQIHFHHTTSGATLAVVNVFAQVTSLVWSTTRREIAATFGYAQPEHDIRIAVFSWPDCRCVVSIPWERKNNGAGEIGRALWAIAYPGGPNDAVSMRGREGDGTGFNTWEEVRRAQLRGEDRERQPVPAPLPGPLHNPRRRGSSSTQSRSLSRSHQLRPRAATRGEGETWASRTQEEGSLIIACCDQTVKFFEVWAGKSKGNGGRALGNKQGVLGGSRVLEGWCEEVLGVEISACEVETIR